MFSEIAIIAICMVVAIVLLITEIFFIPGITLAGLGGAAAAIGGIWYAYQVSAMTGHITVLASLAGFLPLDGFFHGLVEGSHRAVLCLFADEVEQVTRGFAKVGYQIDGDVFVRVLADVVFLYFFHVGIDRLIDLAQGVEALGCQCAITLHAHDDLCHLVHLVLIGLVQGPHFFVGLVEGIAFHVVVVHRTAYFHRFAGEGYNCDGFAK